ncbi:hypothetical protein GF357_02520 [Candidatus Dojkabacteria bacterium]|nr:hypothetical protein [Candidatus Dojkabacteria bacterium]
MLYGFAFQKRNISCRTLYNLKQVDARYLLWGAKSMDAYIERRLLPDQPDHILGMGVFYGNVKHQVRIETKFCNKFKNKLLDGVQQIESVEIDPFLKIPDEETDCIYSDNLTTSYCNLISWKIVKLIEEGKLRSKYCFLHIPKRMDLDRVCVVVERMIGFSKAGN